MKLRVKFTKHGAVRYIGHLDMQRYFQRANRRAGLKVIYSEGFSPHQKMSFAMPLSVGYESDAEYFDLEVSEAESSSNVIKALNKEQASGIKVTGCVLLPEKCENAMASVRAADYVIAFREGCKPPFDIEKALKEIIKSGSFIVKKPVKRSKRAGHISKTSYNTKTMNPGKSCANAAAEPEFREVDIRPDIHRLEADGLGRIHMRVSAGSKDNIRPELIIKALYEDAGFELPEYALFITRSELYTCTGDGKELIPLLQAGEVF